MKSFDVELSSWILTDGNYEFVRFEVGSKVRFALEFYIKQYTVCLCASGRLRRFNLPAVVVC